MDSHLIADQAAHPTSTSVAGSGTPLPRTRIHPDEPMAHFNGLLATGLEEVVDLAEQPDAFDRSGWWAVVATFEGAVTGFRFGNVRQAPLPFGPAGAGWVGPGRNDWVSSLDRRSFLAGVEHIRERIAAGDVYQVNLCRLLSAPLPGAADPLALAHRLAAGNPAAYQGVLHTGTEWLVTASPELFLNRSGAVVRSSPVKGTARPGEPFADKDFPENIMITDLVRNDLGRVAEPGSVIVTELLAREEHPGITHLASTVQAILRDSVGWQHLLAATFPPGSVSGAPKHTARKAIAQLEPVARGPYCGAVGFVDADRRTARLAVGIRTFFTATGRHGRTLNFGTGAGITYPSQPEAEWQETELKAVRLIGLASAEE